MSSEYYIEHVPVSSTKGFFAVKKTRRFLWDKTIYEVPINSFSSREKAFSRAEEVLERTKQQERLGLIE